MPLSVALLCKVNRDPQKGFSYVVSICPKPKIESLNLGETNLVAELCMPYKAQGSNLSTSYLMDRDITNALVELNFTKLSSMLACGEVTLLFAQESMESLLSN